MKALLPVLLAGCLFAQTSSETEVRRVLTDFLTAFNNLDWPAFRQCWADEPVVFYPSTVPNPSGKRTENSADFEAAWRRQFDLQRDIAAKRGVTKAPFQNIQPQDVRVDFPAPTVAVVTFHLGRSETSVGRRMFVMAKTGSGWKITHLHASNLSLLPAK
jgi:ketosteroid isomerase-like protein